MWESDEYIGVPLHHRTTYAMVRLLSKHERAKKALWRAVTNFGILSRRASWLTVFRDIGSCLGARQGKAEFVLIME
ncbi:hypothetical protein cyc_00445 [Cyclospora cayetanensis]|uniref:Uncharacterized protein n=1 Tax=Cyclospora cayetanensis TaxID=88456 RepID=A0A1D3D4S9_9EIME|nr:hypothetical protein cyc_00445 [Cyclospora cayetanensis]